MWIYPFFGRKSYFWYATDEFITKGNAIQNTNTEDINIHTTHITKMDCIPT